MKQTNNKTWQQYEAGKEYKRRLGLYERVRKNERFYRGDQWHGSASELPRPVFNLVRRIVDYLVGAVMPGDISIHHTDERLPFLDNAALRRAVCDGISLLDKNASYRWRKSNMTELVHRALLDAAITGDGIFYCWWDDSKKNGQHFLGDIRTDVIPNTDFFVSDVNNPDLQLQDYVILSGRATVKSLRREAAEAGCTEKEILSIVSDGGELSPDSDHTGIELQGEEKATYLLKFYRDGDEVVCEKSTRDCIIRTVHTKLSLYPITYFSWYPVKKSFHGASPITDIIPNQTYVNTAYAMMMKHMSDTAFSKIVYDKSRIPEWTNEVGEAIAALGGGNVSDAVSVVGVGKMQEGYLDLINNVIENTKGMMGATDSALGDERANNTSAILALQAASRIALMGVDARLCRCLGELASVWADMLCTYCPTERLIPYEDETGDVVASPIDYKLFKNELLRAAVQITHISSYSPATTVSTLNTLLGARQINAEQYLKALPGGTLINRETVLQEIQTKGEETDE